ncbi:hypothetical protein D9M68_950700 [compost metagenome]
MPREGKIMRSFHVLDEGRPFGIAASVKRKVTSRRGVYDKWPINFDFEPFTELLVISECAPHAINARAKVHSLLYPVCY